MDRACGARALDGKLWIMSGEPGEESRELSVAGGAGLAFAVALAATLLMAAPVALAPSERLFGSSQTFARQDPNRDPFIVIEQFQTGQIPGPYLQPLTDLPGRTLARLVSPVEAYNILILGTFPLSAAAAYLLARYVLGSHLGALVAGMAYAFLPFHVAHATNHLHVAQTQWLPLYFLALWRCLDRPDLRRASLLLASAAAVVFSNFYGGLVAAVLSPVALVAYGVVSPRRPGEGRRRRLVLTGLTLAAAAAACLLLVHRVAPTVLLRPGVFAFPRSDLFLYSAKWWSYLVPAVDHPFAGLAHPSVLGGARRSRGPVGAAGWSRLVAPRPGGRAALALAARGPDLAWGSQRPGPRKHRRWPPCSARSLQSAGSGHSRSCAPPRSSTRWRRCSGPMRGSAWWSA